MRKLCIADARVRLSADTGNNPLPCVAAEVQDQVADAVRFLVCTPPDLFVIEFFEAAFNFRKIVPGQILQSAVDESCRDQILFRHLRRCSSQDVVCVSLSGLLDVLPHPVWLGIEDGPEAQ